MCNVYCAAICAKWSLAFRLPLGFLDQYISIKSWYSCFYRRLPLFTFITSSLCSFLFENIRNARNRIDLIPNMQLEFRSNFDRKLLNLGYLFFNFSVFIKHGFVVCGNGHVLNLSFLGQVYEWMGLTTRISNGDQNWRELWINNVRVMVKLIKIV